MLDLQGFEFILGLVKFKLKGTLGRMMPIKMSNVEAVITDLTALRPKTDATNQ